MSANAKPTSKKFASVSFDELKRAERYYFMTSTIVPRPIAVVSTLDEKGHDNLAPFSYFNAISSDPPLLMFSVGSKRDGSQKDTVTNIELNKQFVVHIAQASQRDLVEATSEELPHGVSERAKLGLTLVPGKWVKVPRVEEFAVAYECVLEKVIEMGANTVIFGRVLGAHLREDLKIDNQWKADPFRLDPLARLGREYSAIKVI